MRNPYATDALVSAAAVCQLLLALGGLCYLISANHAEETARTPPQREENRRR